jgi:DNA-binding GntR family transcriptional regulator
MHLNLTTLEKPRNTADLIADALRFAILQGELKGRQPLKQDEIAAEFGVSKIPVREALFQLEAEGLVTFFPNRGAIVSELSAAEVDEIFAMRIALETIVLQRAMPRLSADDLIRAEGLLNRIDHELEPARWSELNWKYHAALYRPADMPRLMQTVQTLNTNVARYFTIARAIDYRGKSQREHRDILEACRRREADTARAHLAQHLKSAADVLIAFLKGREPDDS